ncbi:MAG: GlmU protein, partial [Nitrospinae bacterium]|nr:GlmU protein [Nitrospinota bacterium]
TVNRTLDGESIAVKNGKNFISTGLQKLGALIGDNVVIGAGNTIQAGTVIKPGKVIPARYSVT